MGIRRACSSLLEALMKTDLREIVWLRCGGYCERCGIPLHENDFALHHRKLKSRGGKDELSNLVALHHYCHNLGTDSVHLNPEDATREGFMVASWSNPEETPVTLGDGRMVLLTTSGHYKPLKDGATWQTSHSSHSPGE